MIQSRASEVGDEERLRREIPIGSLEKTIVVRIGLVRVGKKAGEGKTDGEQETVWRVS